MAKILIVEDDAVMAKMYEEVFTFDKHEVALAGDGQQGLVKAREIKPTMILLDVMMPNMNGMEMLEKLKADPETKEIPVVMLTNLAGEDDAKKALALGAVKYIVKSEHEPKQVTDMIKEILSGYTRNEVPEAKPPSK